MDHRKSSEETLALHSTASVAKISLKMLQLASSVSTTNVEIGGSIIMDNIEVHKNKKRNKNRKSVRKGKILVKKESLQYKKTKLWTKNRKNFPLFGLNLSHREESKKGLRLPPLDRPNIHLKDNSATVTLIQKFIAQKLNLNDHTEVDVVCCGEKLNGVMTLKDIQLRWKSHLPNAGKGKVKWELKEVVTQLGYIRSEKLQTPPKI
ncbi:hypothetical protein RDI58_022370 [Solanum bulbocastanum]|uniref:Uncharacterized protein n=1 Tax=Solanum bulbocastanum TaxID=147425 RepID=A0AAN8TAH5_SOLBU